MRSPLFCIVIMPLFGVVGFCVWAPSVLLISSSRLACVITSRRSQTQPRQASNKKPLGISTPALGAANYRRLRLTGTSHEEHGRARGSQPLSSRGIVHDGRSRVLHTSRGNTLAGALYSGFRCNNKSCDICLQAGETGGSI